MPSSTRIVIVGGGFAGAYCARTLERMSVSHDVEIQLIDRRNYLLFSPLLIEAGTGAVEPHHAVVSLRSFLKRTVFTMAEVVDVDPRRRSLDYRLEGASTI